MRRTVRTTPFLFPVLLLAACGGKKPAADTTEPPPVNVAVDNIATADSGVVETGPSLSGTLAAERSAQLRAQTNGPIRVMYVEEGAMVSAGQVLAVIDTFPMADAARSARSQLTSATLGADVAKRNYERMQTLHAAGAIADRDLELAHNQSVAADAAAADARNRLTSIEHQIADAVVRAPFAGVVSERPASAGDVVQMGSLIVTIVDPAQLRLEASVPADQASTLKPGAKVEFAVVGSGSRGFTGRIARINPTVDPTTRQVRVYVGVPNGDHRLVTGSFAEGRVAVTSVRALTIPLTALDAKAVAPSVLRVRGGAVEAVPVTLGVRDEMAERVQVLKGISVGDTLLAGAALGTPVGARVRLANANR